MLHSENQPDGKESQHHLAEVPEERNDACLRPHDAQRVGRSGVSAAVLTNIDSLFLRDEDTRFKIAEEIADQYGKDAYGHDCSFSFLSRMISLILVPEKSKASRIWFSR